MTNISMHSRKLSNKTPSIVFNFVSIAHRLTSRDGGLVVTT